MPVANEVLELAYNAVTAALKEQDGTLSGLRNRATALLSAAAVGTSFAAAVGLLNLDPARGAVFPAWSGWTLLVLIVLIGASVMTILWPIPGWNFGPDPQALLSKEGESVDDVRRAATRALALACKSNSKALRLRMTAYRVGVAVLLVEIVVLLITLLLGAR
jgi:hypothetical protein